MKCFTCRGHRVYLLLLLVLLASSKLRADVTGSISGYVHDTSGAVIPGAHVVLTDTATNFQKEANTDSQGQYTFLALTPGRYTINATAVGFKQAAINNIDVKVNDALRFDLKLAVGAVQQEIAVEANSVQVQTDSTQLGDVIESKQMLAMPLNGRSYLDLLALQAGAAPVTDGVIPSDRPVSGLFANAGNVSVNGQPESANAFLVNGGDVSEAKNMGAGLIPNLDSIQEFRLITNSYDSEYGKFTGAVMNAITKSGSNSFHGDAFEFLRNANLNARNYFDPTKANLHRNQFGYAMGGPFWRNKLFWFTDYQGTRQVAGASTGLIQVPTNAQRAGNFGSGAFGTKTVNGAYWAQLLSQRLGKTVTNGQTYNAVFPGGVIPASAVDPVSNNELKYIPTANVDVSHYANSTSKNTVQDDKIGERVDFINRKTGNWSFYYHFDNSSVYNSVLGQTYTSTPAVPGFPTTSPSRSQMFTLSNTKSLGSTAVNEARASFFRYSITTATPASGTQVSLSSLGFVTGANTLGIVPSGPPGYPESVPPVYFNNFNIGVDWLNLTQADNNYMAGDVFSKIVGSHSLKFGGEYRYYQLNVRNICGPNGTFTFNGSETGIDFADFLLGANTTFVQCSEQVLNNRARYGGLFAQDSWKATPNLTLNGGLRYEVATPWSDTKGELNTFVPGLQSVLFPLAPLGYVVPGDPGVPSTISPTQWNKFGPRIGVAFSPPNKDGMLAKIFGGPGNSSIRAAYGIYYLGAADLGNFGVIGSAPWGLYWSSAAPTLYDTPYVTRSNGLSQGQRFPFTPPISGSPANKTLDFSQYEPIVGPGYNTKNRLTYAEHYNLSIQRQLSRTMVLTLAYVGTQSHNLQGDLNLNPGNAPLCLQLAAEGATPKCGPNQEKQVFTEPNGNKVYGTLVGMGNQSLGKVIYGKVHLSSNIAGSNYNAFQATVERRADDVTLLAAYTFSRSFDNATTTLYPPDFRRSRFLSPFDLTHNFVASYSWYLPFARAFGSLPRRLTDGWSVTGISRFSMGFPVTLTQSGDLALTGYGFDFPNRVGPVVKQNPRLPGNAYFLKSAFASEQVGVIGNSPARFFHGPGIINTDAGVMKSTNITESTSFLIRAEFFNVFNHANFLNPVGNYTSSQFGQSTSTMPARIGQVSAKFVW